MRKYQGIGLSDFLCESFIPSESQLNEFLEKYSLSFPEDYADFILTVNGGTVWTRQTALFDVPYPRMNKTRELKELSSFRLKNSIIGQPWLWKQNNSIRPKFIYEIGMVDDNDSYVCLFLGAAPQFGEIYYYDLRKSHINKKSSVADVLSDKYFIRLNSSFRDFVRNLRCSPTSW